MGTVAKPLRLLDLQLAVMRELGNRGWDKTAFGWHNAIIGGTATMEGALQMEIDKDNAARLEKVGGIEHDRRRIWTRI